MLDRVPASPAAVVLGEDADGRAVVLATGLGLSLVAAVLAFLVVPPLVVGPLALFAVLGVVGWLTHQAETARFLTLVATLATLATLGFITVFLFASAVPALREHGLGLIGTAAGSFWNPSAGQFSLVPMIWATVVVTTIAVAIAGPLGVVGAVFTSEIASGRVRAAVKPGVEVLAGIPSIVYGFLGFTVLNGFVQDTFLDEGASFLIAGIVVGIMALPTVVSVADDAIASVPEEMIDGSLALGATRWQSIKSISVPSAISGIAAAVILGLGRAIGETMAVAAIMAAGVGLPTPLWDIFDASATLTSLIATQYGSASEMTTSVLFVAGILLFVIVAGMSTISKLVERRMARRIRGDT